MQFHDINLGFKGRFQVTIKNPDGSIKTELPWQDNLITDEGLKLMNGINQKTHLNSNSSNRYISTNCFVGSSSVEPTTTNVKLGNFIASNSRYESYNEFIEEPTVARPNYIRHSWQQKYIYTNLDNVNIAEIGLGYMVNSRSQDYVLYTHALIKDEQGIPSTITVLRGEILEVNYEFSTYWDVRPKKGEFTLTKIKGNQSETETYEYLAHLGIISKSNAHTGIYIKESSAYIYSYGVNTEVDTDLSIPYDFGKWNFPTVNANSNELINAELNKFTAYNSRINNAYSTENLTNWTYQKDTAALETESTTSTTRDNTWCLSPYTFNHENGIRALQIPVGSTASYNTHKAWYTVVVAKKGSSHGIPKTDMDVLKLSFRTSVSRYEGNP